MSVFFFFNDPAPPEIYTLPLHDALPISRRDSTTDERQNEEPTTRYRELHRRGIAAQEAAQTAGSSDGPWHLANTPDRKSTRLNSSHGYISYAVFCLKKKKQTHNLLLDMT